MGKSRDERREIIFYQLLKIFFLIYLAGAITIIAAGFGLAAITSPLVGIITAGGLLAIFTLIVTLFGSALNGIFVTALYQFANTGKVPSDFSADLVRTAFKPKKAGFMGRGFV